MARRSEVSREIGLTKTKDGREVRDREREREVVTRFGEEAVRLGARPKLARSVARLLISDSVRIQGHERKAHLRGKRALVVGGAGRTGKWFCRFLSNRGAKVSVWDPRGRLPGYRALKSLGRAAAESDIVVIASPPGVALSELRMVIDASPRGLVFDVCSVKSHIARELRMAAAKGIRISSAHPMFGPKVCSAKDRNVVVCDCGCREANDRLARLFSSVGARVTLMDLENHDELMAYVLGLSHLCSLVFARAVGKSGRDPQEFHAVEGPSFEKMWTMAKELSSESRRVYHDIQALNPNTRKLIRSMERALRELKTASLDADPSRFAEIMQSNRKYLEVE